jgi:tetratricopeptide (TPR) repeat protein
MPVAEVLVPAETTAVPAELLEAYALQLQRLERAEPVDIRAALAAVLLTRDALGNHVAAEPRFTVENILQLSDRDRKLKSLASRVERALGVRSIRELASAAPSGEPGWWWKVDEYLPRPSFAWTAITALCFATALSLIAEIARRFFAQGPDFTGALYTLVQASLTLLAGSALVSTGGGVLEGFLDRRGLRRRFHPLIKTGFAAGVLLVVMGSFLSLPEVARSYIRAGVTRSTEGNSSLAIQDFKRALSLWPDFPQAHYNLGRAYETVLDYDSAASEYQKAIQAERGLYLAYNSLAHVYIVRKNDASGALGLIDAALDLTAHDQARSPDEVTQARFALLKNRGWANLASANYAQARMDLAAAVEMSPRRASPHCLLAQVDEKQNRSATVEWGFCLGYSHGATDVEPVWRSTAADRLIRAAEVSQ